MSCPPFLIHSSRESGNGDVSSQRNTIELPIGLTALGSVGLITSLPSLPIYHIHTYTHTHTHTQTQTHNYEDRSS